MVQALVDLYQHTEGWNWKNSTNWLVGEPCQDRWYGIQCCPLELPFFLPKLQECSSEPPAGSTRRALRMSRAMGWVPSAKPRKLSAEDATEFCATPITGTDLDIAPCLLTQLLLKDNNLVGDLAFTVHTFEDGYDDDEIEDYPREDTWITMRNLTFAHLSNLDIGDNTLSGEFPLWMTELEYIQEAELENSDFIYTDNAAAAIKRMCNRGNVDCMQWPDSGLPPISCTAFGQSVAVIPPQRTECYMCPRAHEVALWWIIMVVFVWGLTLLFALMTLRQLRREDSPFSRASPLLGDKEVEDPGLSTDSESATVRRGLLNTHPFKRWVAATIVVSIHINSLVLVGSARATWPVSIKRTLACMALDYTCFTSSACLTDQTPTLTENFDAQYYTNLVAMVMILVPLGLSWYLDEQLRHHSLFLLSARWRRIVCLPCSVLGRVVSCCWPKRLSLSLGLFERCRISERHISAGSSISLCCSAFELLTLAVTFRISRQLCAYGSEFERSFPIIAGLLLLFVQLAVWRCHFLDATAYLRGRMGSVDHTAEGVVRTAFVVQPFKQRRADWMGWLWFRCFLIFVVAWIGFYGGADYGYAITDPTMQGLSNTIVIVMLIVIWAATSLIEPYEYTFLNTLDSRLSICGILFLIVGYAWDATSGDDVVCTDSCSTEDLLLQPLTVNTALELVLAAILATVVLVALLEAFLGLAASYQSAEAWNGVVHEHVPIWIRGMRWEDAPLFAGSVGVISLHATGSENGPDADMVLRALQATTPAPSPMEADDEHERCRTFAAIYSRLMNDLIEERHGRSMLEKVMRHGAKQTIEMHRSECQQAHDLAMEQIAIEFDPDNAVCVSGCESSTRSNPNAGPIESQRSWLDRQLNEVEPEGERDSVHLDLTNSPIPPTPRQKLGDRDSVTLSLAGAAQPPTPRQRFRDRTSVTFAIDPTLKPPSPSKLPSRRGSAWGLGQPSPLATAVRRSSREMRTSSEIQSSAARMLGADERAAGVAPSSRPSADLLASPRVPRGDDRGLGVGLPAKLERPQSPKETQCDWLDRQMSRAGVLPPPPLERGKPEQPPSPPPSPPRRYGRLPMGFPGACHRLPWFAPDCHC